MTMSHSITAVTRRAAQITVTLALAVATGGILATGPALAQDSGGRAGAADRPSTAVTTQSIPAYDRDLPVGKSALQRSSAASPAAALAAAWVCTVYASDPWKSGSEIEGDGWQSCSGAGYAPSHIKVSIQRSRWYGWQTMWSYTSPWTSADWDSATVWYDCSGDGTYTYRVVTTGWAQGGQYSQSVQSLNYLRVSC